MPSEPGPNSRNAPRVPMTISAAAASARCRSAFAPRVLDALDAPAERRQAAAVAAGAGVEHGRLASADAAHQRARRARVGGGDVALRTAQDRAALVTGERRGQAADEE